MKTYIKYLFAITLISIVLFGCKSKQEEAKKEEETKSKVVEVKLSPESIKQIDLKCDSVRTEPLSGFITIPAKITPNQDLTAHIGSLVQGRVAKVFAKLGDNVRAGQVLMTIESFDIGVIKSAYLKAKAELDFSKANYERQKKLFDEKIGSQKAVSEYLALYQKAVADFKAEDNKIHSIGLSDEDVLNSKSSEEHTSSYISIKSPISGIVTERNVVIGQSIDPQMNAFKVINTGNVWIDGQIYEKDIAKINTKTTALFNCTAYPNESFNGNIVYVGQTVDEKSRTIMIRGDFNNSGNRLKPEMFGELKLAIGENVQAIMISEESVVKESGVSYVFVQLNDTTFEKRAVNTGVNYNGKIEIKDGLKAGEVIVTKGVFYLKSELKKSELEEE